MKDQPKYTPYYHGGPSGRDKGHDQDKGDDKDKDYEKEKQYGKDKGYEQSYEPPPPPPSPPPPQCPDPCDERPPWGPPDIRPECCPDNRACCPEDDNYCTWDEVDDPCVRASSCVSEWTKIECECKSLNPDCGCQEWDHSCYAPGTCVPCYPCEGLLPNGPDGGGEQPPDGDCVGDLRKQLNDLKKEIKAHENQKADLDARITSKNARAEQLGTLVEKFDENLKPYREQRQALICREDCLKGFYRDTVRYFEDPRKFPAECLEDFRDAINGELCKQERAKCCHKNLDEKLNKKTRLHWEQEKAQAVFNRVEKALDNLTKFAEWLGGKEGQFTKLETLMKDQIVPALNSTDPLKQRQAFYLFYWKFAPQLCKRFPVAICCPEHEGGEQQEGYQQQKQQPDEGPINIGCERGDWHPSVVTVEKLTKLICCAVEAFRNAKDNLQAKENEIKKTEANRDFIKTTILEDEALDKLIESQLNKVECNTSASYR